MKTNIPAEIHKKFTSRDKFYGLATMGARGQIVVPAQARKDLKLGPGDQLMVIGKFGKALGFIKASELEALAKVIMKNFEHGVPEKQMKDYMERMFGNRFNHN